MLDRKIHAKNILRQILVGKKADKKLTSVTMCGYDISSLTVAEIPRIDSVWDLEGTGVFGKLLGLEVVLSEDAKIGEIVLK
tara:strand:+ start:263 stop:505 length:243 start_codon:yes stop_codon:yes gene_type:complete